MTLSPPSPVNNVRTRRARLMHRYTTFITPRGKDGLPSLRVLLAFPALLLIVGILLIGFAINGTSSGAYYSQVHVGQDPDLIAGHPQGIRSDEWNVATYWAISQVQQGLPEESETFPGGMDAAVPQDLPRADWSVAFRPHLMGYVFLDLDQASAWKWWLPALSLLAAAYCFVVTVLPRRPATAALLSIGFYFSPFFQWWFMPGTMWPAAWAFAAMAALAWSVKCGSARDRWIWAAVVGYLTVVMAMGLYAPFIVPAALVVPLFAIGLTIERCRKGEKVLSVAKKIAPTVLAGVAAGAITLIWLFSKAKTVDAFLNTDYPGVRLTPTGSGNLLTLARTISSSFSDSLRRDSGFLGVNSSEASTFFLIGAFLLPIAAWAIYRQARRREVLPWTLIGLSAVVLLFVAFVFVPGWDPLAHLLFLDRSTGDRLRIGLGIASFAILVYLIRYLDDSRDLPGKLLSAGTALLFILSQVAIAAAVYLVSGPDKLGHAAPLWWLHVLLSAGSIYAFSRRRVALGTISFALVAVLSTITVNPVYRGVFDLRGTAPVEAVMHIDKQDEGRWVGIGTSLVTAMLVESGVEAYNGVQGAPSHEMWREIDPTSSYKFEWNRLGGVNWVSEAGPPRVFNPSPDQIFVTFDACSPFAQKNVSYVLTDVSPQPQSCLRIEKRFALPNSSVAIYRVVSEG